MLRLLSITLASAPLWAAPALAAAQATQDAPPEERPVGEAPPLPVAESSKPRVGCCALWTIIPIELSVAALFGGLVAGTLALGEHREGYTSAAYTIDDLNHDHEKARTGAIVADGFYIAAAGGAVVQLAVILPLCLTTKICETELSAAGRVQVGRRGELVISW
jgi:hypothetical protein